MAKNMGVVIILMVRDEVLADVRKKNRAKNLSIRAPRPL